MGTLNTLYTLNTLHPAPRITPKLQGRRGKTVQILSKYPGIQLYGAWLVLGQATWVKLVPMNI